MANDSKVFSETDLFSTMLKSDYSSVNEDNYSWKYLAKTYFNNSKQLRNSISNFSIKNHSDYQYLPGMNIDQMLKTQNTNAPWLFNVLKKKFHRSKKSKNNREIELNDRRTNSSILLAEEFLERPISSDGTSGRWIINEKDVVFPLVQRSTSGQYNISRAISSTTIADDSLHLHHYHYDFQPSETTDENTPIDFNSIATMVKTYYRQQIESNKTEDMEMTSTTFPGILEPINEDLHLPSGNSTTSKRAKSASASARSHRQTVSSSTTKRGKRRSESTQKKKKSKYYQEHQLNPQEIELRQALRLIDLDNMGFFSPNQFRKVLKEIGIHSNDIDKIERCLPLDDDGHYSIDNLIKLFLDSKT